MTGDDEETVRAAGRLALARCEDDGEALARAFRSASPFPHVVLRDFLELEPDMAEPFPEADWPGWERFSDGYQTGKATCNRIDVIPEPWRSVILEFSQPRFLRFLEQVTGIPKLLPDPYLEGGGLHRTGSGGHLSPHTDFHVYPDLELYRRVNVLLYLNPGWTPAHGGWLTLHAEDDDEGVVRVEPSWGTCVIFQTDDRSVHGVVPLEGDAVRRSIALYYYTSSETTDFGGDQSTHWRTHGEGGAFRRARVWLYLAFMKLSRLFSMAAHLVNPNFGLAMVREQLARRLKPGHEQRPDPDDDPKPGPRSG